MSALNHAKGASVRFTVKSVTRDRKGAIVSTEYKDYTMAEFMALKDKPEPEDVSIQVDGLTEDDIKNDKIEIDIPEAFAKAYEIRTRVVHPPKDATWKPFVTGRLVRANKLTDTQVTELCAFFGI